MHPLNIIRSWRTLQSEVQSHIDRWTWFLDRPNLDHAAIIRRINVFQDEWNMLEILIQSVRRELI
jgi:hypothetical protein